MTDLPAPRMGDLLQRTAAEIRNCRVIVLQLEDVVHNLVAAAGTPRSGPLADLQAIDLLDQRLADLAAWADMLADACAPHPAEATLEALGAGLRLEEMRQALTGQPAQAAVAAGHTEFF